MTFDVSEIEGSIGQRFRRVAEAFSERLAVHDSHSSLTYGELEQVSDRVARGLRHHCGVGTAPVAMLVDHQSSAIAALLGILKAGRAYLALDPHTPLVRLTEILLDAGAACIISDQEYQSLAQELAAHGRPNLFLEELLAFDKPLGVTGIGDGHLQVGPDALAAIFYTSGSTGEPKGVGRTHRQILHYAWSNLSLYHIRPDDRQSLLSFLGFAGSVSDIFHTLLNGAALFMLNPRETGLDQIIQWLVQRRITLWHPTVDLFRQVCGRLSGHEDLTNLRMTLLASQALYRRDVDAYRRQFPAQSILVNRYGMTEATAAAQFLITSETQLPDGEGVPVGYPVDGFEIILLDDNRNPVALGEIGEIAVRSRFLAPGYLNKPELTREVFLPDPGGADQRIYLTGDLGRMPLGGPLELVGRKDFRVKIRGYRVELSAVEAALLSLGSVKQAVVAAQKDSLGTSGEDRLVAYLVPTEQPPITVTQLREQLARVLPEYMIPAVFVWMEQLPLTASGKVDRRSLPAPEMVRSGLSPTNEPPANELEAYLMEIWGQILGVERVGVEDNFFELGGDSLSATRILTRLSDKYPIDLGHSAIFEHPTVRKLALHISSELDLPSTHTMPEVPHALSRNAALSRVYPLTFIQQSIWFQQQLDLAAPLYNMPKAFRLTGALDYHALQYSLLEIVSRHQVLRSRFEVLDGVPVQKISQEWNLDLPVEDLAGCPAEQREQELFSRIQQAAEEPFDLTRDLLLRARLYKLAGEEHVLLIVFHHIASDFWSINLFNRELSALYQGYASQAAASSPHLLPGLQLLYGDYAVWQRSYFTPEHTDKLLAFWFDQLQDAPTALDLPTDKTRPAIAGFAGGRVSRQLPVPLTAALITLSQQQGATLFMTMLTSFAILLYRYTGQDDILIGSPVAGRNQPEVENLIGAFINTLVYRCDLFGDKGGTPERLSFVQALNRVRDMALQVYAHQELAFEKLLERLKPERSRNRAPLFQVMLDYLNTPLENLDLAGVKVEKLPVTNRTSIYDLTLFVHQEGYQINLSLEYSADLFHQTTAERMLTHLETLLKSIVSRPNQAIGRLGLLTELERRQILLGWNNTWRDYTADPDLAETCAHQIFERQARRSPQSIAVQADLGDDAEVLSLTYGELERRANQLAHYLRAQGVELETLVGICMERSPEMIVAVLGVLKAGGAYVPLDPGYPAERLAYMIQDAGMPVILSHQRLSEKLTSLLVNSPDKLDPRLILLDTHWHTIAQAGGEKAGEYAPSLPVAPDNLAYMIYTSGSTGQAKGVMITHRALCNHLYWMQEVFPTGPTDRFLQSTSFSFDVSACEIFTPWLVGAQIVLARPDAQKEVLSLLDTIQKFQITVFQPVTSLLQALIEDRRFEQCTSLRYIFCGGEAIPPDLPARVYRSLAAATESGVGIQLVNLYGPSEATIDSICWICPPAEGTPIVPIGKPIANLQAYILDEALMPLSPGLPGEIYLGGVGLARGYHRRPQLTAERFIPDPFVAMHGDLSSSVGGTRSVGGRIYRTGDRGRYLPDGNIEFLGRVDDQIKLRGFRVELGEIQHALQACPGVRQALVVLGKPLPAATGLAANPHLIAYVVPEPDKEMAVEELRRFLASRLPDFMLPKEYVFLDALPLGPSGKIDRRSLPAPAATFKDRTSKVAPRNDLERVLVGIWEEILGVQEPGIHDSFFDLGGHSLLAVRLIVQLVETFQVELPMRSVFEAPTIAQVAELIKEKSGNPAKIERIASLLLQLAAMSDEQAEALLASKDKDAG
ncbi:MAG: amino acid adenylation domain-containing protein [Anaerolineales bacterium]|nr:amino acid adenylation domain-containing protein [Anaerolineales bacterium]